MFPFNFLLDAINLLGGDREQLDAIMTAVKIQQEDLDQFATDIAQSADLIAQELAALVASADNPLTDADVTALQAAVDQLKGLEPPHAELQ